MHPRMDIHTSQNNGNSFLKAEHDVYSEQQSNHYGDNINHVEHLHLGDQTMPAWYKNAIQRHLERNNLAYSELQEGAGLNEQEYADIMSTTSLPRIDVIERICNWLGISIAELTDSTPCKEPVVINIQNLSVAGDFISGDLHIAGGVRKHVTLQTPGGKHG